MQQRIVRSLAALAALALPALAQAKPAPGPEINPFACQGQAEVAQADRSIAQIRLELRKKEDPLLEGWEPATVRALKYCVVAELKKRVGDADAIDYYEKAIAENPDEPGYEFFAGRYYGGARGARGTVVELAEKHYYRALEKLEKLKEQKRYRDYHAVVEDQLQKGLLVLYQQDGLPLLPWKAHPQHSDGYLPPGLSIASEFTISKDTRATLGANEMGGFAAEAGLRQYRRAADPITEREQYDIVRNPLRYAVANRLRLRQTYVGAVDVYYSYLKAVEAQIPVFNFPSNPKVDVTAEEFGVGYERNIPLYPLFDLRAAGSIKRVSRSGVVEYFPDYTEDFNVYEVKPAISRFIGSDKLTIGGTYVFMDIPPLQPPACVPAPGNEAAGTPCNYTALRGRAIWAANVEYAFYSPILLPSLYLASFRPYRTPTRGTYLYAGYVNDNEVFGDHRTINETFYAGARLEGPGLYNIGLTETFYQSTGKVVTLSGERVDDTLGGDKSLRSTLVLGRLLVNPDETPGIPRQVGPFASDTLNLVFPLSWDKMLQGTTAFESVRVGGQLWWKVFGTGIWGATLLGTVSYDYQYYYNVDKHMHNAGLTLRLGWGDL